MHRLTFDDPAKPPLHRDLREVPHSVPLVCLWFVVKVVLAAHDEDLGRVVRHDVARLLEEAHRLFKLHVSVSIESPFVESVGRHLFEEIREQGGKKSR